MTSESSPSPPPPTGRRILLVEDSADARDALRLLLELDGHAVSVAADGSEALARAAEVEPEVALIDIGLPVLDGYDVARRLRAMPLGSKMRLIALTGYGQPEDQARVLEAGFDGHLVKPVDPEMLSRHLAAQ
ncbi:MAG TPA: response regulator [Methylomirabilota bacterium]|nr:response regulator [Methylomirabilota bacterium]